MADEDEPIFVIGGQTIVHQLDEESMKWTKAFPATEERHQDFDLFFEICEGEYCWRLAAQTISNSIVLLNTYLFEDMGYEVSGAKWHQFSDEDGKTWGEEEAMAFHEVIKKCFKRMKTGQGEVPGLEEPAGKAITMPTPVDSLMPEVMPWEKAEKAADIAAENHKSVAEQTSDTSKLFQGIPEPMVKEVHKVEIEKEEEEEKEKVMISSKSNESKEKSVIGQTEKINESLMSIPGVQLSELSKEGEWDPVGGEDCTVELYHDAATGDWTFKSCDTRTLEEVITLKLSKTTTYQQVSEDWHQIADKNMSTIGLSFEAVQEARKFGGAMAQGIAMLSMPANTANPVEDAAKKKELDKEKKREMKKREKERKRELELEKKKELERKKQLEKEEKEKQKELEKKKQVEKEEMEKQTQKQKELENQKKLEKEQMEKVEEEKKEKELPETDKDENIDIDLSVPKSNLFSTQDGLGSRLARPSAYLPVEEPKAEEKKKEVKEKQKTKSAAKKKMAGWLHKRTVGIGKKGVSWRKRYFRLRGLSLVFFKDEDPKSLVGDFDLNDVKLVACSEREFAFTLSAPGRTEFSAAADTNESYAEWISVLCATTGSAVPVNASAAPAPPPIPSKSLIEGEKIMPNKTYVKVLPTIPTKKDDSEVYHKELPTPPSRASKVEKKETEEKNKEVERKKKERKQMKEEEKKPLKGYMHKKAITKKGEKWQERWFSEKEEVLYLFKSDKDEMPIGETKLKEGKLTLATPLKQISSIDSSSPERLTITIEPTEGKELTIRSSTIDDYRFWASSLQRIMKCEEKEEKVPIQKPKIEVDAIEPPPKSEKNTADDTVRERADSALEKKLEERKARKEAREAVKKLKEEKKKNKERERIEKIKQQLKKEEKRKRDKGMFLVCVVKGYFARKQYRKMKEERIAEISKTISSDVVNRIEKAVDISSTKITLSGLRVTNVPPQLYNDEEAVDLFRDIDLSNNNIGVLPIGFRNLVKTQKLSMNRNRLTELPFQIGAFPKLTTLVLSNNRIVSVTTAFKNLTALRKIDLSSNKIKELPSEMSKCLELRTLLLDDNKIDEFPSSFEVFKKLEVLDLRANGLEDVPAELSEMMALRELNLSENKLDYIQAESFQMMENLEILLMDSNRLDDLPEELFKLRRLRHLSLKENSLSTLPSLTKGNCGITELYLDKNCIENIPEETFVKMNRLEVLSLASNRLDELPTGIGDLENLTNLNAKMNNLSQLPVCLGHLRDLKELDVSGNPIHYPPKEVMSQNAENVIKYLSVGEEESMRAQELIDECQDSGSRQLSLSNMHSCLLPFAELYALGEIEELDISYNKLKELPSSISELRELKMFNLSFNELEDLPREIANMGLVSLNLSSNKFSELPRHVCDCESLQELYLTANTLATLPSAVGNLANLTVLYCDQNTLKDLPEDLGELDQLSELVLSNNSLQNFPSGLCKSLSSLKILILSGNKLRGLPESLGRLRQLVDLQANENKLAELPDSIGKLYRLTSLGVAHNELTNIPESVGNLETVNRLFLSANSLTELPLSLVRLTSLMMLDCEGNDMIDPPISVIENGAEVTLKYLKAREEKREIEDAQRIALLKPGEEDSLLNKISSWW